MAESENFQEKPPRPPPRRRRPRDDDDYEDDEPAGDDTVATIIPYKNPKALTGYYVSIFGLAPVLGLILAPTAIVLGIMGLRHVNKNPKAKGTAHAIVAIVLGIMGLYNFLCVPLVVFMWFRM